jgi:hypothetical protein
MVELVVVQALAGPFLLVLGSAASGAIKSFSATERSSRAVADELLAIGEIERTLRSGRRRTLLCVATKTDVSLLRAATIGSWFPMPANEPRTELEVTWLTGDRELALLIPSQQLQLRFVRDPVDKADGLDNDRDGLVDEGSLQLFRGSQPTQLLGNVEVCTFKRVAIGIEITLRCAQLAGRGTWRRTNLTHTVVLNNP